MNQLLHSFFMARNRFFTLMILCLIGALQAQPFTIARVHYSGGGDWYSDPSSLPNLLTYVKENTPVSIYPEEVRIKLTDDNANQYPYLYLTGHGNIRFTDSEVIALRSILMNGGFLHADDNYGMDASFRREIKRVFPNRILSISLMTILFSIFIIACLKDFPRSINTIINPPRPWPCLKTKQ